MERLNQRWEIDSTKGDVMLADGKRHNVVAIIDVYSRRPVYHVSRSSSATAVAACLRKALLAWGVPEILVTDNGSDYVSRHIKGALIGLGIEQRIAPPFYALYQGEASEKAKKDYEITLGQLKDLAKGLIVLQAAGIASPAPAEGATVLFAAPHRLMTGHNLEGF